MKNVEITIRGPKGAGKTMISSIIYNALKEEGIVNINFKSGMGRVLKMSKKKFLRKEFVYFFNEDNNSVELKEELVRTNHVDSH